MDTNGILDFFGLLAIVVVAVFILMLIVDWLLCVIDGRDGIFFKKRKDKKVENTTTYTRPEIVKEEKVTPENSPLNNNFAKEDEFAFDYLKAEEERKIVEGQNDFNAEFDFNNDESLKARSEAIDSRKNEFDEDLFDFDETSKDEEEVITRSDEDYDRMINEISDAVMANHVEEEPVVEEPEVVEEVEEINDTTSAAAIADETVTEEFIPSEEVSEQVEETIIQEPEVMEEKMDDIRVALEEEIARLQAQLAAQQQENELLRTTAEKEKEELLILLQKKAEDDEEGESKVIVTGNLKDLKEKLAILQERLKVNEKDLRLIKKEFVPLRKVKRTLEKDEKKLRRREALVAKQKVVLYGVNNYVDLDEEKAKKLTEELDLLEGLKFSVAHCQEVMEKNKERYPILENTYNILMQTNAQIKQDIEEVDVAITALEAQQVAQEGLATNSTTDEDSNQ